ncbi:hypothetical protein M0802_008937 [Mischocyttarus mexicanus]|nr:hypothetical protein M0802_008937 [Mischocyttarus mexicanus]
MADNEQEVENAPENDNNVEKEEKDQVDEEDGGDSKSRRKRNIITVPEFDVGSGEHVYRRDAKGIVREVFY